MAVELEIKLLTDNDTIGGNKNEDTCADGRYLKCVPCFGLYKTSGQDPNLPIVDDKIL